MRDNRFRRSTLTWEELQIFLFRKNFEILEIASPLQDSQV